MTGIHSVRTPNVLTRARRWAARNYTKAAVVSLAVVVVVVCTVVLFVAAVTT